MLLLILCTLQAIAEEGLVVRFAVEKTENNSKQSYTNAVLMKFNETVRFDFEKQYQIKIQSWLKAEGLVDLTVTVKDQTSGKPYYVGVATAVINVGDEKTIIIKEGVPQYAITLDTAYRELPQQAPNPQ